MAWGGIKDALAAGDLTKALKIAVLGLDVIWKGFLVGLQGGWNEFKAVFVDGWHEIAAEAEKLWDALTTKIAIGIAEVAKAIAEETGQKDVAQEMQERITELKRAHDLEAKRIDLQAKIDQKARDAARSLALMGAAADLAAAKMKLQAATKRPPVEAGPMPREVARKAAVEALGNVHVLAGGYGVGFDLLSSGESIQKNQLEQLEEINENTKGGGGLTGY